MWTELFSKVIPLEWQQSDLCWSLYQFVYNQNKLLLYHTTKSISSKAWPIQYLTLTNFSGAEYLGSILDFGWAGANQYTLVCSQFCPPGGKLLSDLRSSHLENYGQLPGLRITVLFLSCSDGDALHVFVCTLCYAEQWVHKVQIVHLFCHQHANGLYTLCTM